MKFSKAEIEAVIAASPRVCVPFNKLVLSETYQARTAASTSKMSLSELAASIREHGILQNLVVVKGLRGLYEVCAGGRRLEALTLLHTGAFIPDNYPVPVLIVPADKALMASLAENVFHVAMHAADEFTAFAKLIDQGKSVEDVAAAFGVTPLVVKRRMKLATVSPKLLAQFREDQIGLDCLMVLASVDDHAKQEEVWSGVPNWNRRPDYLRQLLNQGEIESDRDPVARYVTPKAYEGAGGAVRRDLFSEDEKKVYLLDAALLERLAEAKLSKKAKQVAAEGWKWVDVRVRYGYDEYLKYGSLRKARREPTEHEAARMADLDAQLTALENQMDAIADAGDGDGDDESAYEKLESEVEAVQTQQEELQESLNVWPAELMTQAGCVVFVGNDGTAAVKCGLVRPEDRSDMVQAVRHTEAGSDDAPLVSLPSPKTRPVHSEKLMRRLTAHRVQALQAELLERPDVAVAALTAQLAQKVFRDNDNRYYRQEPVFAITATDSSHELRSAADDLEGCAAWTRVQAERDAWAQRLPADLEAIFPWLLEQNQATVLQLLTFVTALTTTGICGTEPERQRNEALAQAVGLDMRKWWTASGASYFNHVSKGRILDVVTEAVDANAASPLAALKKDDVVSGAEQTMTGTGWLPTMLRVGDVAPEIASQLPAVDAMPDDAVGVELEEGRQMQATAATA